MLGLALLKLQVSVSVPHITIVYAQPTYCSYGFDSMTLYTDIEMEPIPIHCDAAVNEFRINPVLPEGMSLNPATGTISGRLTEFNNENIVYTVTATTTGFGSTETTFTFRARNQIDATGRRLPNARFLISIFSTRILLSFVRLSMNSTSLITMLIILGLVWIDVSLTIILPIFTPIY